MIDASIVADSVTTSGERITTLTLIYPRYVHAEFMTHRVFSRNAQSSRAIPLNKMIGIVYRNPAVPNHWGANQSGMQAYDELKGFRRAFVKLLWWQHRWLTMSTVWLMDKANAHKQLGNRLLEPHNHIRVVVTSTQWANFLALRDHHAAEPAMQELARAIRVAMDNSDPELLQVGEWHLPFVTQDETDRASLNDFDARHLTLDNLIEISVARCARTSYFENGIGKVSKIDSDRKLYKRLVGSHPIHASPAEHQATPDPTYEKQPYWGNFRGWVQYRKTLKGENIYDHPFTSQNPTEKTGTGLEVASVSQGEQSYD